MFATHQTWENTTPNRIGGGGFSNDRRMGKAEKHKCAVAVERLLAHVRMENSVYKIRWFALSTWYPAGKDFSMTCS